MADIDGIIDVIRRGVDGFARGGAGLGQKGEIDREGSGKKFLISNAQGGGSAAKPNLQRRQ